MEVFKDISGYEGLYKVSSFGRVLSLSKGDGNGNRDRMLKQEIITRNHTNYRRVTLSKGGKVKRFQVHRLVAMHFIENPKSKKCVNHIDSNGENNMVDNLEWCTNKENMEHSRLLGRQEVVIKARNNASLLSHIARTKARLKSLLGDRLIDIDYEERTMVRYLCTCGKEFKKRTDSIVVARGGICINCTKTLRSITEV